MPMNFYHFIFNCSYRFLASSSSGEKEAGGFTPPFATKTPTGALHSRVKRGKTSQNRRRKEALAYTIQF